MGILNAHGAFAEYVSVPLKNIHLVPENLSDEEAVFVEPLAAAFEILTQVQAKPQDDVLVLGDGKLGNLCAQVLQLAGTNVTTVGKYPDKLALLDNIGVRTLLLEKLAAARVRHRRGSDRVGCWFGAGAQRCAPARDFSAQEHHCRQASGLARAGRDQRDQCDRVALRAVSPGARSLGGKADFSHAFDRENL